MMYRPRPPLDQFVECLWYMHSDAQPYRRERALPTGTVELVINLFDDPMRVFGNESDEQASSFAHAVICGPQNSYFVLDTSQPSCVIGVHCKPAGSTALLGVPASLLTDRHVALDDVWKPVDALRLRNRLREASRIETKLAILEAALLARLSGDEAIPSLVRNALHEFSKAPAIARVGEVEQIASCSGKWLLHQFREAVGLTPKRFCRIQRFQSLLSELSNGRRVEWSFVAQDCGYYDQAHMIREFRSFAGVSPGAYAPVRNPSHMPVEEDRQG